MLPAARDPLIPITVHLSLAALFAIGLAWHLSSLASGGWFEDSVMAEGVRRALIGVLLVSAVTSAVLPGLFATGIALRYAPSMQYLLIGSGVVVSAISTIALLGLRVRLGGAAAFTGSAVLGAACIAAVARYLSAVGTGPDGGLIVSGSEFGTTLLVWVGAAVIAVVLFVLGVGRDPEVTR